MRHFNEHSAGVIPCRLAPDARPTYLLIHSATVRNPIARWEFPKGHIEPGETPRQAAAREFEEETGIVSWSFRDGFEESLAYTYVRQGQRRLKIVTYFIAEVFDHSTLVRSREHVEDRRGQWYLWGDAERIGAMLSHAKGRRLLRIADAWLRGSSETARADCAFEKSSGKPESPNMISSSPG
jgi:8-oxo-dGTP pyrophosphatase MutT (NUDIX family)